MYAIIRRLRTRRNPDILPHAPTGIERRIPSIHYLLYVLNSLGLDFDYSQMMKMECFGLSTYSAPLATLISRIRGSALSREGWAPVATENENEERVEMMSAQQ